MPIIHLELVNPDEIEHQDLSEEMKLEAHKLMRKYEKNRI